VKWLIAVLALVGCGSAPSQPSDNCGVVEGSAYLLDFTIISGDCPAIGSVVSVVGGGGGGSSCSVVRNGCTVTEQNCITVADGCTVTTNAVMTISQDGETITGSDTMNESCVTSSGTMAYCAGTYSVSGKKQ
jgi:hypothetical protein